MKILVVLPRFPWPLEKGDKLRAYHQIVELSKRHDIYLFCVSHQKVLAEHIKALEPFCREIRFVRLNRLTCALNILRNRFSSKSLQMGYWNTKHSKRACRSFANEVHPDVVYNQMIRTMPLVARLPFPKVMDFQDALSMNTERRMEQSHGFWRHVLHYEFKMLRSSEYKAFSIFNALTIISEVDSEAIPHKKNGEIHIIPNGVDFDYFKVDSLQLSVDSATQSGGSPLPTTHYPLPTYDLVFCGNMSYAPNVDAARYLVNDIMPLVWQSHPQATLLLAGAAPKAPVRTLASSRVVISGHLPDIREAYASAQIFIAPMRIGSGLQNKLLEAMSMNLPCVTTSLANTPLEAVDGQQILVGDTPQTLADAIVRLLESPELRECIATEGNTFVHSRYSWPAAVQPLEDLFNAVRSK